MKHSTPTVPSSPVQQLMSPAELQEQIRRRAYEIYEQNGQQDGLADQDWFQAEAEILGSSAFKAAA